MGISIAPVGLQIVKTNVYAHNADVCLDRCDEESKVTLTDPSLQCYEEQSADISTLLNFGHRVFSFTLGFQLIPFAETTTFGTV
jgi:hypothetical protein